MTMQNVPWGHGSAVGDAFARVWNSLNVVCVYVGLYLALDWISFIHVLPTVGYTLWNPPPACSLALLLAKGLRYAPLLFVVSVVSDGLTAGFPAGLAPTVAADAIIAAGYTSIAVALKRFAHADLGFRNVVDIAWFLGVASLGVLAIAALTTGAFVLMQVLPPTQFVAAVNHFWVGDLTGITGLLPALLCMNSALHRWNELSPSQRLFDVAAFAFGTALALFVVFVVATHGHLHVFYLLLLPIIWVSLRHGLPWSAMVVLATQLALISAATILGYQESEFLAFQFLSLTLAATGLLVGAVVTERLRADLNLRRQRAELERMARLTTAGALGTAVVHQISQPLATIATYAHACRQMLLFDSVDRTILSETMAKAEAEVLRAGMIVERLRDFFSNGRSTLSSVNLEEVVRDIIAVLTADTCLSTVDIQLYVLSSSPVCVDRIQIEQVLVNLIRNAIDATTRVDRAATCVRVRLSNTRDWMEVAVEDDGLGISSESAERLFEPFETSKHNGMGLGLWLSRELVEGHGGRLWWDPDCAAGTRFVFRLPLARANLVD